MSTCASCNKQRATPSEHVQRTRDRPFVIAAITAGDLAMLARFAPPRRCWADNDATCAAERTAKS